MRKMFTVFSGAIFALALSFSAVASAVAEEPAQPVDYALSESRRRQTRKAGRIFPLPPRI